MSNQPDITIAVSILTANFLELRSELDRIIAAKIPAIHFDVMDNHFVPNISFGPKILKDVAEYVTPKVAIDCHLMTQLQTNEDIGVFLQPFLIPGVRSITLHYEALSKKQLAEFLNLSNFHIKKGLAISPKTEVNKVYPYLESLDFILIMSVEPGFGQQKFLSNSYQKIKELNNYLTHKKGSKKLIIGVDGGINDETAPGCIAAGATYLVSGSYLLNSANSLEQQLARLKK